MKYQHFAARFAAKEAVFKAISTENLPVKEDFWTKIEIYNRPDGKPMVNLEQLGLKNIMDMDLSISHLKDYAIASFTVLFN